MDCELERRPLLRRRQFTRMSSRPSACSAWRTATATLGARLRQAKERRRPARAACGVHATRIHSDRRQEDRIAALEAFRRGKYHHRWHRVRGDGAVAAVAGHQAQDVTALA